MRPVLADRFPSERRVGNVKKIRIDEAFALVARAELARRGLGVPWLARESSIPERTLRNIPTTGQATKLWHVCRVSTALGVPCAEMVARADAMVEH